MKAACHMVLTLAASAGFLLYADAGSTDDQDIAIAVEARDDLVLVDVNFTVPVTPAQAWMVLTDYDHMADFLPNIRYSKIMNSAGHQLHVAQQGKAYYGPFSFSYELLQEVALQPYAQIRSHAIGGSIKQADALTRLIPVEGGTRIVCHSESAPTPRLPGAILQAFAAKAAREHYEHVKEEIMRRNTPQQK